MFRFFRLFKKQRDLDCDQVRDLSSDYLDEQLPRSLMGRFRYHLQQCQNCNAFVATLKATIDTLRGLPLPETSQDLKQRILKATREQHESSAPGDTHS